MGIWNNLECGCTDMPACTCSKGDEWLLFANPDIDTAFSWEHPLWIPMQLPLSVILEQKPQNSLFSVPPEATVLEAVQLMNRERIGSVLVCDKGVAVGIFTERDVLVRVVVAGKDPGSTLVSETMTCPFVGVRTSTTVEEAMRIISTKRCRHLPVRGENDKIVGMVSIGDLMRWIVRDQESQIDGLFDYITGSYPG